MNRFPAALKSVPRSKSVATLLTLTDHGTTGAITGAGAALTNFSSDNAVEYHEGLLRIEVLTTGGKGATPTAVGASKTFTLKYAFTEHLLNAVADATTVLAGVASSLVCALPNASSVQASATITFTGLPTAGQTVTIGGVIYTFVATTAGFSDTTDPTHTVTLNNRVLIGADENETAANLVDAINLSGAAIGVTISGGAAHPTVVADGPTPGQARVKAINYDTSGNALTVSETCSNATWDHSPLTGGSAAGTLLFATDAFVHLGRYLYIWYDRTAFAANAKIDVSAKLVRL